MKLSIIKYSEDLNVDSLRSNLREALCQLGELPCWSEETILLKDNMKNDCFAIVVNDRKVYSGGGGTSQE